MEAREVFDDRYDTHDANHSKLSTYATAFELLTRVQDHWHTALNLDIQITLVVHRKAITSQHIRNVHASIEPRTRPQQRKVFTPACSKVVEYTYNLCIINSLPHHNDVVIRPHWVRIVAQIPIVIFDSQVTDSIQSRDMLVQHSRGIVARFPELLSLCRRR